MVAVVVFAILRSSQGDPAVIMAGDGATPERIEQIRQIMGLDQPVVKQFFIWAGKLVQGDLGTSLMSGVPVARSSSGGWSHRSAWRPDAGLHADSRHSAGHPGGLAPGR